MILVDTSVWIDFFRGKIRARKLTQLLTDNQVLLHPWVLGELMLGNFGSQRNSVLADLRRLPPPGISDPEELFRFIEHEHHYGKGLSWVDIQLLVASRIEGCQIWTHDRALHQIAEHDHRAFIP